MAEFFWGCIVGGLAVLFGVWALNRRARRLFLERTAEGLALLAVREYENPEGWLYEQARKRNYAGAHAHYPVRVYARAIQLCERTRQLQKLGREHAEQRDEIN